MPFGIFPVLGKREDMDTGVCSELRRLRRHRSGGGDSMGEKGKP